MLWNPNPNIPCCVGNIISFPIKIILSVTHVAAKIVLNMN